MNPSEESDHGRCPGDKCRQEDGDGLDKRGRLRMLRVEQPGKRGRPKMRLMEVEEEDMNVADRSEEDAEEGASWRRKGKTDYL